MVKKNIESTDGTPNFPKKRLWGNLDADWLELRTKQLSLFLNTFLAHPHVKACKLVPIYFKGKAYGEGSQEAIQNLIAYMNGQPIPKNPNQRIGVPDAQGAWGKDEKKGEIRLIVDPSKQTAESPLIKKGSTEKCKYFLWLY